ILFKQIEGFSEIISVHERALELSVANAHVWGVAMSVCLLCNPNWIVALAVTAMVQFRLSYSMFIMGHCCDDILIHVPFSGVSIGDKDASHQLETRRI